MTDGPDARDLVRRGYDAIADTYAVGERPWLDHVPPGRILDLGCGRGEPVAAELVARGDEVVGVDISSVQIERARAKVPGATFVQADIATLDVEPGSFDAVVSFYALIHLPRGDQQALWPRVATWLRPGGTVVAMVGTDDWQGVDDHLGAPLFWDHPAAEVTLGWFAAAGLEVHHRELVPEGESSHTLVVARRV